MPRQAGSCLSSQTLSGWFEIVASSCFASRCWVRSLGRPWSASAKAAAAMPRGVFRGSHRAEHLSPGTGHHRPAGSLLGAGIRVTGSRLFAWPSSVLRARLGGAPAMRLLGCARSGSSVFAGSSAAQPINQPDMPQQAGSCRLSLR